MPFRARLQVLVRGTVQVWREYEGEVVTTATEPIEITFHADNPYATAHPAIRVKLWDIPGARSTGMRPESVDAVLDSFPDISEADRQYAWDLAVES